MSPAARPRLRVLAAAASLVLCLLVASTAAAQDRIYWADAGSNTIAFANLDGSGGGTVDTGKLPVTGVSGLVVDPRAQRVYWSSQGDPGIFFASLVGAGFGRLETGDFNVSSSSGIGLDAARERVYWTSSEPVGIFFGELDGSLAGPQAPTNPALGLPNSLAIDSGAGRMYWAGNAVSPISFADFSGGGGTIPNSNPAGGMSHLGLAVDNAGGRIYWADEVAKRIGFAALNGSGSGVLNTAGATAQAPRGVAIDPGAGRIYWADSSAAAPGIGSAKLDGSGGQDLHLAGPKPVRPRYPVIFADPRSTALPSISGATRPGATLSCAPGGWAADQPESLFYAAPHDFAFQWTRDGLEIRGATTSILTADATGDYQCQVTATNVAGATTKASPQHAIVRSAFGKSSGLTLKLGSRRVTARGALLVRVANSNPFPVSGSLAAGPAGRGKKGDGKGAGKAFKVGAGGKANVRLTLSKAIRSQLGAKGRLRLSLTATVRDLDGNRRTLVSSAAVRSSHG